MTFLGLKKGQDPENQAAHPHQEFPEIPPHGVAFKGTVKWSVKWATESCNLFCNIAAKRVENRCWAFYHPHQTYFATNQVFNRFERGWLGKKRKIAFQLNLQQCCTNRLHVFVARFTEAY